MMRTCLLAFALLSVCAWAAPVDRAPVPKGPAHVCSPDVLKALNQPVTVGFFITADGTVGETAILHSSGSPDADRVAADCVKGWTYEPALKAGVPVVIAARTTLQAASDDVFYNFGERKQTIAMSGVTPKAAKALDRLIHDVQARCPSFYRVGWRGGDTSRARNRVAAHRLADGTIETTITQSSPVKNADDSARDCVVKMIGRHDDLPPVFSVEIDIIWTVAAAGR